MKCCEKCDDGEGNSVYPYYGVAPHICGFKMGLPVIGSSTQLPEAQWPENFVPDPDCISKEGEYPGCGTYTHCVDCGAGK